MKAFLMHPNRDFKVPPLPRFFYEPQPQPAWPDPDLIKDLELDTLLGVMAGGDRFLSNVARTALLTGFGNSIETIRHRQANLQDSLNNREVVRELYKLTLETIEAQRGNYFGVFVRYPAGVLSSAIRLLTILMDQLQKLKDIASLHAARFESAGFRRLFETVQRELSDEYFGIVRGHLEELEFRNGTLVSAGLGSGNESTNFVLRRGEVNRNGWLARILGKSTPGYTFHIDPRDEAGARIASEMRDRGINLAANAVGQATEHVVDFFDMLRLELAFYICCINLHDAIRLLGAPSCLPDPQPIGSRKLRFNGLYDICLALNLKKTIVGNSVDADDRSLVVITGANQGGKSSFLRSVGLAQVMMQSGMFVAAESFSAELSSRVFTHYRREEDVTMKRGKLDEELSRMSDIVTAIRPNAIVLFNESFAATNEREGSEIARQVVSALLEKRIKVLFVTHLYDFAETFFNYHRENTLFLRAERQSDGTRTFKMIPGAPLETSFGEDLYHKVFEAK